MRNKELWIVLPSVCALPSGMYALLVCSYLLVMSRCSCLLVVNSTRERERERERERDGTGSETLIPDSTRPDPDAFDPVTRPGHWVSVLWIERLFGRQCATSEYFLTKVSGLCSTEKDHVNVQHNCKFIRKTVKIKLLQFCNAFWSYTIKSTFQSLCNQHRCFYRVSMQPCSIFARDFTTKIT